MTKKLSIWFILGGSSILTVCFFPPRMLSAQAINESQDANAAWRRALIAASAHDFAAAIRHADVAIAAGLAEPIAFYRRGRWHFRVGQMVDSLRDFDRYIELAPDRANSQWERGITCYYAKQFKLGTRQFEDYQKYHDGDVENVVWRYLCQLQVDGKERARAAMLPLGDVDRRVPMMEIYGLFRGASTPDDVLAQLKSSEASGERAKHETFDAHLYLALYFDSENDLPRAKHHIDTAVQQFKKGDYMWAVAVQHQKQLERRLKSNERVPQPGK